MHGGRVMRHRLGPSHVPEHLWLRVGLMGHVWPDRSWTL